MCRYLLLINFTDQGIRKVGDSVKRAKVFKTAIEKAGGALVAMYWALGEFDGAVVFEAPDDATATSLILDLGSKGFVRTRTARVFNAEEFGKIAKRG